MEVKVNLHVTASPELMALLSGLTGKPAAAKTTETPAPKTKVSKTETPKAEDNGKTVDLSTIRSWAAKSEANKAAARNLLKSGYDVEKLTDLPAEKYPEFWAALQSENEL